MDERIKKTLDYIESHLELGLNLGELSKIVGMSSSQFHRLFKKETKRTPFKFIEEIRVNKAYNLILEKQPHVGQLALKLGYKDYETFTRAFKRYFMLAPDDIKSIILKIKKDLTLPEDHSVFLATLDVEPENQDLTEVLQKIIKENNITWQDLEEAVMFKVIKKSDSQANQGLTVKNKYEVIEERKIWQKLIDKN
ncbi:MAG: helix-turn-helix transcriptional regulator [Cyclobacteriaceae bacterium]